MLITEIYNANGYNGADQRITLIGEKRSKEEKLMFLLLVSMADYGSARA